MLVKPLMIPLEAHRGVEYSDRFKYIGQDWTAADFKMQVREKPDMGGSPILDLTEGNGLILEYGGTATVTAHIAAGRLSSNFLKITNPATGVPYVGTDNVTMSILLAIVAHTGMNSFPEPAETGDDWVGAYDILIDTDTAGSADWQKRFYGPFTLKPTVTVLP